jgi:hypothetical protein
MTKLVKLPSETMRLLRMLSFREKNTISDVLENAVNAIIPQEIVEYKDLIAAKRKLQNEKEAENFNYTSAKYRKVHCFQDRMDDVSILYKITQTSTGLVYIGSASGLLTKKMKDHYNLDEMSEFLEAFLDSEITDWTFQVLLITMNLLELHQKEEYYIKKYNAQKAGFNHG